ncbi:MAG: hypothetical protein HC905_04590 [Bacteroidales bacterium]|nr:hypothetical protein [Bacteroidales bacterium]
MANTEIQVLFDKILDLKIQRNEKTKTVEISEESPTSIYFGDFEDEINDGDPPPGLW